MITHSLRWLAAWAAVSSFFCGGVCAAGDSAATSVASPDGRLAVDFRLDDDGRPLYSVLLDGRPVLRESRLGLVREDADFSRNLRTAGDATTASVNDDYNLVTAKRRKNQYRANEAVIPLATAAGARMDVVFRVSNDGVAFRYVFPEQSDEIHRITEEVSSFHMLPATEAWLQPMSVAKTGWSRVNPCYEELYEKEIPVGTPSNFGAGWVYPALFRSGDVWLAVSECGLGRGYCGTRLQHESPSGEYRIGLADPREVFQNGPALPESTLPWQTPWRIIAIGNLATIAESTLGTDLANPPTATTTGSAERIVPGKASWSWPLLKDDATTYDVQKRFIDYAADMGWRYCLIDALWDTQIGYERIEELVDYARGKNVEILLWYNSNGDWNDAPQTPRHKLLSHEGRIKEFDRLKEMGVAGLKIDFFGGDGQSQIDYYLDILEDAAPYGFLINFHGATLPRGWQRTYPHLMTLEGVRGMEFVTFEQANADQQPSHCAMLPFTRNLFDPMDFTPLVLDQVPNLQRRTTSAFELATAVLFTSGIQHYAETPEGMAKAPRYVRDLLKHVPSVWEDAKFIDGYPGKFVAMARKGDGRWYVAGINGENSARTLELDLSELGINDMVTLITDSGDGNMSFRQKQFALPDDEKLEITLEPNGGFVLVGADKEG
jgi:alpha-glucosidase